MMDGKPAWRDADEFPTVSDLFIVIAGPKTPFLYYLAWWRWHKPWFKERRKVWRSHNGIIYQPMVYMPVGELLKLPFDRRAIADIERDLEASRDQQSASSVRGNAQDVAN